MKIHRKIIAGLAKWFLVFVVLIPLSFWIELKFSKTLPVPTGHYKVGRVSMHITQNTRLDSLSPAPHSKRELLIWVWFPALDSDSSVVSEYIPKEWNQALYEKRGFVLSNFFARDGSKIICQSLKKTIVSAQEQNYPVLLLKSGIGSMAIDYSAIAEELASRGYIVVGSDSPYSTWLLQFPDGRLISRTHEGNPGETATSSESEIRTLNRLVRVWTDDTHFILDQLEVFNSDSSNLFFRKLKLSSVGIFGHSFGGATAAQFCLKDPRCKAGVNMDGAPWGTVVEEGLQKPFMFLLADHINDSDQVSKNIKSKIGKMFYSSDKDHYWIYLNGAGHFNFSDLPFQKEYVLSRVSGGTGSIGGQRGNKVISDCLISFFDKYLKEKDSINLYDLNSKYSEVRFNK